MHRRRDIRPYWSRRGSRSVGRVSGELIAGADHDVAVRLHVSGVLDPAWPWTVPAARLAEVLPIGPSSAWVDDAMVGFASVTAALTVALSREIGPLLAVLFAGHRAGTGLESAEVGDDRMQGIAEAR